MKLVKKIYLFLIFTVLFVTTTNAQLVVNEASNANSIYTDENGKTPDWIELYNNSASPINLSGFYITNDINFPTKWQLPNIQLNAYSYFTAFASGDDIRIPLNGNPYHTNFKLSNGGCTIYIINAIFVLVDQLSISDLLPGHSQGKKPNGVVNNFYFSSPTKGGTNNNATSYLGYEPAPTFSVTEGFYNSQQQIALSSISPTSIIHYTISGEEPTLSSPIYTVPFIVGTSTTVAAKCSFTIDLTQPSSCHVQ